MNITAHYFSHAVAPVIIAIAEAVCPEPPTTNTEYLTDQAAIVQTVGNPHDNENVALSYEFYKKRLGDAATRATVGTCRVVNAAGIPVAVLPLAKPPDLHLRL